mgnify:CR=1 FL=1
MNIAVIFAGGVGSRMHSKSKPKQFLKIHGVPIIIHTLQLFETDNQIDAIVIACIEEWIPYLRGLIEAYHLKKVKSIVPGGNSGQDSIYNGLKAAENICKEEKSIVLIHDGVRPLISHKTIEDNIASVKKNGSAVTTVKAKETVVVVKNNSNEIEYITARENSRFARAPQSFWLNEILEAHEKARSEGIHDYIDSCTMMQSYGKKIFLVEGPEDNIKITTPEDFYIMRALLDAKENSQIYGIEE